MTFQDFFLILCKLAPLAARKRSVKRDPGELNPFEIGNPVADSFKHPLYLVKFPLGDRDLARTAVRKDNLRGLRKLAVKVYSIFKTKPILLGDITFGAEELGLRDVILRRENPVTESAVVCQDQKSGRVLVKPPGRKKSELP